jgi:preprotein translocase subunit SecE
MRATKDNMTAGYPSVSQRLPGPVARVAGYPARIRHFLHEVRLELRQTTWPTAQDVRATTVVVIIAVFFFGFYLGTALDVPLTKLMNWLLQLGKRVVG